MEFKSQKSIPAFEDLEVDTKALKVSKRLKSLTFEDISSIKNKDFKVTYIANKKARIVRAESSKTTDSY